MNCFSPEVPTPGQDEVTTNSILTRGELRCDSLCEAAAIRSESGLSSPTGTVADFGMTDVSKTESSNPTTKLPS